MQLNQASEVHLPAEIKAHQYSLDRSSREKLNSDSTPAPESMKTSINQRVQNPLDQEDLMPALPKVQAPKERPVAASERPINYNPRAKSTTRVRQDNRNAPMAAPKEFDEIHRGGAILEMQHNESERVPTSEQFIP